MKMRIELYSLCFSIALSLFLPISLRFHLGLLFFASNQTYNLQRRWNWNKRFSIVLLEFMSLSLHKLNWRTIYEKIPRQKERKKRENRERNTQKLSDCYWIRFAIVACGYEYIWKNVWADTIKLVNNNTLELNSLFEKSTRMSFDERQKNSHKWTTEAHGEVAPPEMHCWLCLNGMWNGLFFVKRCNNLLSNKYGKVADAISKIAEREDINTMYCLNVHCGRLISHAFLHLYKMLTLYLEFVGFFNRKRIESSCLKIEFWHPC